MTDGLERKDGIWNLWGFGWTVGGLVGAALVAGFFLWFYGTAAMGVWHFFNALWGLPVEYKTVVGALLGLVLWLYFAIWLIDRELRSLRERIRQLERRAYEVQSR